MIKINEIFYSIQGESSLAGWPTVFVRTTACNLRCTYCDTKYSYFEGQTMSLDQIIAEVKKYNATHVCVTGGEPLAQKNTLELMKALCDMGQTVSLETNGFYSVVEVDPRVIKVVDIKTPDSGEGESFNIVNLEHLSQKDQLKFVICSQRDYDWAKNFLKVKRLNELCQVFLSPAFKDLSVKELAEKILEDSLPVRLQIQLHKYIWNPLQRGV